MFQATLTLLSTVIHSAVVFAGLWEGMRTTQQGKKNQKKAVRVSRCQSGQVYRGETCHSRVT